VIAKELRALLPAWGACAAVLLACAGVPQLRAFGAPAYFVGASAVGAFSVGHEYTHRTLHVLLSQPISRHRIIFTKLGVLAALLAALLALASATVGFKSGDALFGRAFLWLPVLAALFISPWLTLAVRSPVGGTVFTVAIVGMLLTLGDWIGVARYGYTREVDAFRISLLWQSMTVLCAVGAVMTVAMFGRLEAIDGRGAHVDLAPRARTVSPGLTRRRAGWLLLRKELRIQQLAFAIAAVYVAWYVILVLTGHRVRLDDVVFILTTLYAALTAIVIGSLASAEERQMRTLDANLLLPISAARQWQIKAGTALVLTLLLAFALPVATLALLPLEPAAGVRVNHPLLAIKTNLALLSLTALSLYVSSLCASGLWALVLSIPSAFAVVLFLIKLGDAVEAVLYSLDGRPNWRVMEGAGAILVFAVIAVVLRLASANHRSADHGRGRIAAQVAIAAAAMTAAVALAGLAGTLTR
jgi:hypothetical protein